MGLFRFLFWDQTCPIDTIGISVCLPPSSSLKALLQSCVDHFESSRVTQPCFLTACFFRSRKASVPTAFTALGTFKRSLVCFLSIMRVSVLYSSACLPQICRSWVFLSSLQICQIWLKLFDGFKSYLAGDEGIDPPLPPLPPYACTQWLHRKLAKNNLLYVAIMNSSF